jgi:hypothetical protein
MLTLGEQRECVLELVGEDDLAWRSTHGSNVTALSACLALRSLGIIGASVTDGASVATGSFVTATRPNKIRNFRFDFNAEG